MNKFLAITAAALVLAAPSFAQKMGSANNNPPAVTQTVEANGAKISLNYSSITWATGKTIDSAMNKETGGKTREYINSKAKSAPLGEFTTSVDVTCGDLKLAAGTHKVAFTINDNTEWEINFTNGDKTQTMKLPLNDSGEESKRLMMCLFAGEQGAAGVYVAFGKKMCILNFVPAAKAPSKG